MNTLILIDGDHISENLVPVICKEANAFRKEGDSYEIHYFGGSFKDTQSWREACYQFDVESHFVPGTERLVENTDPNTSDIALTVFAVEKLYENPELETVIIVANDKDYVPLAARIKFRFQKRAVMFYTEKKDAAAMYYDDAVLLNKEKYAMEVLVSCIESLFEKYPKKIFLNVLDSVLSTKGIDYGGKTIAEYLADKFQKFPDLNTQYELKKSTITRIAN